MSCKTKIVHLTSVHPIPDPRIFLKECTTLSLAGYDVTVLACLNERELDFHGYRILSIGIPTRSRLRRLVYQLRILKELARGQPKIVHFHDPELLPLMYCLEKLWGHKSAFVFDIHEDYSTTISAEQHRSLARAFYTWLLARAERKMTFILAEDSYHDFCRLRHPVVHNYPLAYEPVSWEDRANRVVYLGSISQQRGAITMIQGFAKAQLKEWELLIVGKCNQPGLIQVMADEAARLGVGDSVRILDYLPAEQAMSIVSCSRAGLSLLHPSPNYMHSLPTKVFEYLSAGVPVILSDFPYYRQFFKDVQGIIFVDPLDTPSIGSTLSDLAHTPDVWRAVQQGRQHILKNFSWGIEGKRLLEVYQSLSAHSTD